MKKDTLQKMMRFQQSPDGDFSLSEEYKCFENHLRQTVSGEGMVGENSYLLLWEKRELVELNDAYEVLTHLKNVMLIGSDGGGTAYGVEISGKYVEVPFVGMSIDGVRVVADDFDGFIAYLWTRS